MFLIIIIGILYIVLGFCTLIIPLLFVELSGPRDLIKSGFIILLGIFLLVYKNLFNFSSATIISLNAIIVALYTLENFSYRWNQLLDKEKLEIKSFNVIIKKLSEILNIINLSLKNLISLNKEKNILKNNASSKKWVRDRDNIKPVSNELPLKKSIPNVETTNFSREDIISDEKFKKK